MIDRRTFLPLFLLMLLSLVLAACGGTPAGSAAGPGDPAGIRAAVPAPVEEQVETAAGQAVFEAPNPADVNGPDPAPATGTSGEPVAQAVERARVPLHQSSSLTVPDGPLSDEEVALLTYMREEEKLALDVYTFLYDMWGLPIFSNIAASEAQHVASVLSVLDAYGVADPAADLAPGQFADAELQALYEQLVAHGALSPADALLTGGLIEEVDVADLEQTLSRTGNQGLVQLFTNLRLGSANHLLAFAGNYERQTGTTYLPQHLDAGAFDALLAEATGRQGGNRNGQVDGGNGQATGATGQGGNGNGRAQGGNGRGGGGNATGYRGGQG